MPPPRSSRASGSCPWTAPAAGRGEAALTSGLEVLRRGELFGIYPEGTRSPDGRLYRGKTGVARVALETGVPVMPVAMIDTEKVQPLGKGLPRIMRPGIRIGAPLDFRRYEGMEEDRFVLRSITDEIMYEMMILSGQEYVDIYAASMKDRLVAAARAKAKELQREGHDRSAAAAAAQAKAVAGTASTSEDPAATAGTGPQSAPPTGSPGAPSTDAGDRASGQLGRCPPRGVGPRGRRPVRRSSRAVARHRRPTSDGPGLGGVRHARSGPGR